MGYTDNAKTRSGRVPSPSHDSSHPNAHPRQARSQTFHAAMRSAAPAPRALRSARAAPLMVGFSADPDASALALVWVTETWVPDVFVETTGGSALEVQPRTSSPQGLA